MLAKCLELRGAHALDSSAAFGAPGKSQDGGLLLAAGAFAGFNAIHMMTAVQLAADSQIRGRVLGLFSTLTLAAIPVAAGVSGVVADLLQQDIASVYTLCGAGLGLSPLILLSSPRARTLLADRQQAPGHML